MTILAAPAAAGQAASNTVVPGILGFLVVAGMAIVLFFLLRSMNKQLRKVTPPPARPGRPGPARAANAGPAAKADRPGGGQPDQGGPGPG